MMMKVSNSSMVRVKVKNSGRLFHDEDDGGQGQLTSPDEGQGLRMMKIGDCKDHELLEAL